eukprot:gene8314-8499_t
MSLFNSKEWWSTRLGTEEEFDQGCICISNIDNNPDGTVKIITGSLQGVLRIHLPHQQQYHIEDILLETELESSILQLSAGSYLGGNGICLAVLHPRTLAVYNVSAVGSSYLQLNKIYEHHLEHTAANMAAGPFGGVSGCEHIVVQSYDGQLTFFEQEAVAFSRGPAPICKRIQYDWKVVLGESALDIKTGRVSSTSGVDAPPDILVLAEHTFFIISLRGQLLVQRRLDYHPSCCCAFPAGSRGSGGDLTISSPPENLLIATHTKALLVYRGQQLAWAAKLELQPVAVHVAAFAHQQGMIVALDDKGKLSVLYLGSEPPKQSISFANSRQLDYTAMEQERRSLLAKIQAAGAGGMDAAMAAKAAGGPSSSTGPASDLVLKAQVPSRMDAPEQVLGEGGPANGFGAQASNAAAVKQLTITLLLHNTSAAALQDLSISVLAPAPAQVLQPQIFVGDLLPTDKTTATGARPRQQPLVVQVVLQAPRSSAGTYGIPATNTAEVVATYKAGQQQLLGVSQLSLQLPMGLFCQVVSPAKNSEYKITLSTNRDLVQLTTLFGDMLVQAHPSHLESLSRSQGANVMSFAYSSGQVASILGSKNGGRYRLQSDCFQSVWLVMQELCKRLMAHFAAAEGKPVAAKGGMAKDTSGSTDTGPFAITFEESLPLQDLFELVDAHFAGRELLATAEVELEQREVQFRSVQKLLLVRYKDQNAGPLNQLDTLMEETYSRIVQLADKVVDCQSQLASSGQALGGGVQLMLMLIRAQQKLYSDVAMVGWEEVTEAAMTQLLKTTLARSAKDTAAPVPPLTRASDTARLKKHVSLVLERLSKGMRLLPAK